MGSGMRCETSWSDEEQEENGKGFVRTMGDCMSNINPLCPWLTSVCISPSFIFFRIALM